VTARRTAVLITGILALVALGIAVLWRIGPLTEWFLSLTDHQLNVIGTVFSIVASLATALGVSTTVYSRLAAKNSKAANIQTQDRDWVDGQLVPTHRHRLPTTDIPLTRRDR
jgi:ABC-type multidrug transport system fused ATPase/permease subunit